MSKSPYKTIWWSCFFLKEINQTRALFHPSLSYHLSEPGALSISALEGRGLKELKKAVEEEIVNCTGKHILDLKVDLSTAQLRCVLGVIVLPTFDLGLLSDFLPMQLAVQGSHGPESAGERWRQLGCCQCYHQHRHLWTLQEDLFRVMETQDVTFSHSGVKIELYSFLFLWDFMTNDKPQKNGVNCKKMYINTKIKLCIFLWPE